MGRITHALRLLPQGTGLSLEEWQWRHRILVITVFGGVAGFALFALFPSKADWHITLGSSIPLLLGAAALWLPLGRRIRAALASAGLIMIAILAVHHFGTIEAHFLFFIMIPLVALYEDWVPFATAAGLVIVHHAMAALFDPALVYNHADAIEFPLTWSLIHSALFLAMCAASVLHWNVSERTRARERATRDQLEWMSLHDPLTGLANRVALENSLQQALTESHPERRPAGLLMIDIDGFKQINDSLGHATGDRILRDVAQRLRSCVRPGDTIARMGGDEFAVVLPGSDKRAASMIAQRIVANMVAPMDSGASDTGIGVSVGVAIAAGAEPETLLRHADLALYAAKRGGRGRFTIYSHELAAEGHDSLLVDVGDARAWSLYVHRLRTDIAVAKEAGKLPGQLRGPETARRTLETLVAAIDQLPPVSQAQLALPQRSAVEEFVFHHDMVQSWSEGLTTEGILSTPQPPAAGRFWHHLKDTITSATN